MLFSYLLNIIRFIQFLIIFHLLCIQKFNIVDEILLLGVLPFLLYALVYSIHQEDWILYPRLDYWPKLLDQ